MQIYEIYSCEQVDDSKFGYVYGRWSWKLNLKEQPDAYRAQLQWFDLFGKLEKRTFDFEVPGYVDYSTPLSLRAFLLKCREGGDYPSWWILNMDWTTGKCQLGTEPFSYEFPRRKPLVNRAEFCSNNIQFIFYGLEEIGGTKIGCSPCIIDVQRRQIQQTGADFQLPSELFHCLDLNGKIISGLSTSLNTITQFDLESRAILKTFRVHGLPPTVCLFLQEGESTTFSYNRMLTAGLWTSTNLYVWSEEKKPSGQTLSTIYDIPLDSGVARALSHSFDGRIRRMVWGLDDELCVRVDKIVRTEEIEGPLGSKTLNKWKITRKFKLYRIKPRCPESLTFMAAAALPPLWTADIKQILDKRYEIPMYLRKI